VTRTLLLPLLLLFIACAGDRPPADFLRTTAAPWNDWMNTIVSVDITNVPLGTLASRSAFQGLNLTLAGVDPEYPVALQAERVTRRQALWKLAERYGLAMTAGTNGLTITNRELHRPNTPLN
jgi:hypothetical protein